MEFHETLGAPISAKMAQGQRKWHVVIYIYIWLPMINLGSHMISWYLLTYSIRGMFAVAENKTIISVFQKQPLGVYNVIITLFVIWRHMPPTLCIACKYLHSKSLGLTFLSDLTFLLRIFTQKCVRCNFTCEMYIIWYIIYLWSTHYHDKIHVDVRRTKQVGWYFCRRYWKKHIVNSMKIISIKSVLRKYKSLVKVMTLPQTRNYSLNRLIKERCWRFLFIEMWFIIKSTARTTAQIRWFLDH